MKAVSRMKRKELYSLSFEYVKANKKVSLKSIITLTLCITFLCVSLFIFFEFRIDIMKKVYDENIFSTITLNYSESQNGYMNKKYKENIEEDSNIKENVLYKQVYYNYYSRYESNIDKQLITNYPILTIDNINYSISINKDNSSCNVIEFYNLLEGSCYLEEEKKYMNNNNLGDLIICGNTIEANEKSIMINRVVLDDLNISYNDVIGKKVSYKVSIPGQYNLYYNGLKYEQNGKYINIFENYIIKGVFNNNIYSTPTRNDVVNNPIFWISDDNIFEGDIYNYDNTNYRCYYNDDPIELSKKITNDGKVFLADYITRKPDDMFNVIYQYKNFNSAYKAYNNMSKYAILSQENGMTLANCFRPSNVLNDYIEFYPKISMLVLASLSICGAVFIMTLINLILIIYFQRMKKKHFFGVLRAIGYTRQDIKNILNYQIDIQYFISIIFSFIISTILNLIIVLKWNNMIDRTNFDGDVSYKINLLHTLWVFILINVIIYLLIKTILMIYNKISKSENIIESLKEE